MTASNLISVVVPAFNAQSTLDETLRSVRGQSYGELEIIVVDDGSSDDTAQVAGRHQAQDARVLIIRQANAGVAAARNAGAATSTGAYLAFIDADDLWAREKLAKQLAALTAMPGAGLAYCWHARIDGQSRVTDTAFRPAVSGDAAAAMCVGNVVGSGSSALVTRAAFEATGGFDPSLRARAGQGCEDLLFYFRAALFAPFAVVPEHLVGYRQGAMSGDLKQMLRSWRMANNAMLELRPNLAREIRRGRALYAATLLGEALRRRSLGDMARLAFSLAGLDPAAVFKVLIVDPVGGKLGPRRLTIASPPETFVIG